MLLLFGAMPDEQHDREDPATEADVLSLAECRIGFSGEQTYILGK